MKSIPALDHNDFDPTRPARPRRALNRRGPAPLALEARVMFDGATADAAVAAAKAAVADVHADIPAERTAERQETHVAAAVQPPVAGRQEIVFIEDNVQDYRQLAAGVPAGVEVVVLDHTRDGLQQMLAALDGHAPVDAIHLVTHGGEGEIDLGAVRLNEATLEGLRGDLTRLGRTLAAGADLLVYGCDVAEGSAGARFVQQLAAVTGADVAASLDTTGAAVFGGDWTLETQTGAIEAQALHYDGYGGVLGVFTAMAIADDNRISAAEAGAVKVVATAPNNGQAVDITVTDGTSTLNFTNIPTSGTQLTTTLDLSTLRDGTLTFTLKQGNNNTSTTTALKDAAAPDTRISAATAPADANSASFSFDGTDNSGGSGIASYQYQLDNGAWTATGSTLALSDLAGGAHTLNVRAIDQVGNVDATPASYAWTSAAVNHAPVATGSATLAPIADTATNPPGATVASLFGANFHDADSGDSQAGVAGVAIVSYTRNAAIGEWQVNTGGAWVSLASVDSAATALTFKATDALRFVPANGFTGSAPAISVKLIDAGATVASNGVVDASGGGGTSHISADAVRLTTSVKPTYSLASPDSKFVTLLSGNRYDPVDDTQSNAADTDLVGTAGTPLLLGGYDSTSGDMYYRVRIGDPTLSKGVPVFGGVVMLGLDTNGDGKLDVFIGVDGRNSGLGVVTYAPGADANVSPSTTSITGQQSVNGPSNRDYTYTLTGGNVGADSKPDAWLTFKLPFDVLAARVASLTGQAITPSSSLSFVLFTLTQNNSINGDIGGIGGLTKAQSATTWKDLGLLQSLNLSAPVLTDIGGNVQFVENGGAVALAPAAGFNDLDSSNFSGGKLEVTISANADPGHDLLGFGGGRVTASGNALSVDGVQVGTFGFAANVLTVNFTAAGVTADQVAAVTRAVSFSNTSDTPATANRTVQFKATDGDGNASAVGTVTVLVQAVDDAPTVNGGANALNRAVTSNTVYTTGSATTANGLILAKGTNSTLSVADVDAGGGQVSVTLGVDKGVLELYNGSTQQTGTVTIDGVTFSGASTGTLVMTGTIADINTFLAGANASATKVLFQPGLNPSSSATLTLSVNDRGNSGSGGPLTGTATVGTITIAMPSVTGTLEGRLLEDNNVAGGQLAASGTLSYNISGASWAGNSAGTAGPLGTLTLSGATWTYKIDNSLAAVQALANGQSIQESYKVVTAAGTVYVRVTVGGVNDAPTLSVTNGSAGYTENGAAVALFSGAAASLGGGESGQGLTRLALDVSNVFDGDQLVIDGTAIYLDRAASGVLTAGGYRIDVTQNGSTTSLSINTGEAGASALQSLVTGLAYQSTSDNPTNYGANTSRGFTIKALQDNGGSANGGSDTALLNLSRTLAVTAVNDAPVVNTAPVTLNQDSSIVVDNAYLRANDPDTRAPNLVYTLTGQPGKGTLKLGGAAVTSFTQQDVDSGRLTYTAGAYASAQADAFVVSVSDGSATVTNRTVAINIITTDYAPATEDVSVTTPEDIGYVFRSADFAFRDANTGDALSAVELSMLPAAGTLQVYGNGAWTDVAAAGTRVAAADIEAGRLRFMPARDTSGTPYARFDFKVVDKTGLASAAAELTVGVIAVNDAPAAADATVGTPEDTVLTGTLPAALDAENDAFTYAKGSDGAHGSVTVAPDGSYTYTPVADFNGDDSFTYTVSDGNASNTYTVHVTVTPVNDAPIGADARIETAEDTAISGRLPVAVDVDRDTIVYAKAGDPAHGTVTVAADGSYTYVPNADYNGSDSFRYTIDDGHGGTATCTVAVTVTPLNDAPAAANTAITTAEDTAYSGRLPLAGDAESDGVTYTLAGAPQHGNVSIDAGGGYIYIPAADYHGADSFRYTVRDGQGGSNTYTVDVTVTPVNDAPVAANATIATLQDTAKSGSLPAALDADGDNVIYAKAGDPAHGSVTVDASGSYTYTPVAGYSGIDGFSYTVSDGQGGSNTYTVGVTVGAVNHAPAAADARIVTAEDTRKSGTLPTALDADGDRVAYTLAGAPQHGSVSIGVDGGYTYTPAADYHGADRFRYTVGDGKGGSNTYTVEVTITPVNDAPTAGGTAITTPEDTARAGTLPAALDADGDNLTYDKSGDPAHGSVTIGADGTYLYTPDADYHGTDSFGYTVSDGRGGSNTYTVNVTVTPVNDAPVAANASIATLQDTAKSGSLPAALDADGDNVIYAKAGDPAHGSVTVDAGGSYTYTPVAGYSGSDSFRYTVSDGQGGSNTYTVGVTVGAVNHAPAGSDARITTAEDTRKTGTLPTALDADGDRVAYTLAGAPQHGSVTVGADGGYTYTPAADYHGADSFRYTVSDGKGGSNTYTVEVAVTPVNDAPTAGGTAITTPEDTARAGTLPAALDADGDSVTYAKAGDPAHGSVTVGADGTYLYTPDADYHGADSFGYSVSDGQGGSNTYTVDVTVTPVNDAPVARDAAIATREDTPYSGSLPAALDADGDSIAYTLAGAPQHGSVSIGADGAFSYTPGADYNGSDSFRYTVGDGHGGSNTYTVAVTVEPVNDAPIAHGNAAGRATVGEVLAPVTVPAFTDIDSATITYSAVLDGGRPLPSWLVFDPVTRSFGGTPPRGSAGTYTVLVTGSDGELSAGAGVTITVADPAAPGQKVAIDTMTRDTGASPTDFITGDGTAGRTVSGSLDAPLGRNEAVEVSFDGGASWATATVSGSAWSAVDGRAHDANWTIEARVTNTAAGVSGASAVRDVVLDSTPPAAPTVDSLVTTSTTPVLGGSAATGEGETLQVAVNGVTYGVTPRDGRWTLDLGSAAPLSGKAAPLGVGQQYAVTATVTDLAGNARSGENSGSVTVTPPQLTPQPVAAAPAPVVAAPAVVPASTPVAEPAPVNQAVDTRVNSDAAAPGSLASGDTVLLGSGQGTRAGEQAPVIDLRAAELSDVYTRSEGFRTVVAKADAPALVVFQGVPDQFAEVGSHLALTVPADAFAHTQPKAVVRLAAVQQDGRALPAWIQFNGQTGQFTGDAPKGLKGELRIKLIARDAGGREAIALFRINLGQNDTRGDTKAPAGKPGLSAQLRAARPRA